MIARHHTPPPFLSGGTFWSGEVLCVSLSCQIVPVPLKALRLLYASMFLALGEDSRPELVTPNRDGYLTACFFFLRAIV